MAADPSLAQLAPSGSYRALTVMLRVFATFAVITGLLDVVTGLRLPVSSGAHLPAAAVIDPVLNSHIKYMGAVWAGFGAALWWTTHDLGGQAAMLRILLGTVFLGGIGRLLSALPRDGRSDEGAERAGNLQAPSSEAWMGVIPHGNDNQPSGTFSDEAIRSRI